MRGLTSTQGSHNGFKLEDVASVIPVGGPRKLSQTSRRRDSSASLHLETFCLFLKEYHVRHYVLPYQRQLWHFTIKKINLQGQIYDIDN